MPGCLGARSGPGLLPAGRLGTLHPRTASPPDPPRPAWPACRSTSAKPSGAQTPSAPPWLSGEWGEWGSGPGAAACPAPPGTPRPAHGPARGGGGGSRLPPLLPASPSPPSRLCNATPHPQRPQRGGHPLRMLRPPTPGPQRHHGRRCATGWPGRARRTTRHLRGRGLTGARLPVPSMAPRGDPGQGEAPHGQPLAGGKGPRSSPSSWEAPSLPLVRGLAHSSSRGLERCL